MQAEGEPNGRDSPIIALGANMRSPVGEPLETLKAALKRLEDSGLTVSRASRFYSTPCVPAGFAPDFVNAVIMLDPVDDAPEALLERLHDIEAEFARSRERRWDARTLDLDLLAVGQAVLPDAAEQSHWRNLPFEDQARVAPDRLILPHPRLQDRGFVLIPLAEIAPQWVHPVTGQTVLEMRNALPESAKFGISPL